MKKLLLFLLSLTLIITPACKRNHKSAALITTGTVATAAGATGLGVAAAFVPPVLGILPVLGTIFISPLVLIAGGIALIVTGAQLKKENPDKLYSKRAIKIAQYDKSLVSTQEVTTQDI